MQVVYKCFDQKTSLMSNVETVHASLITIVKQCSWYLKFACWSFPLLFKQCTQSWTWHFFNPGYGYTLERFVICSSMFELFWAYLQYENTFPNINVSVPVFNNAGLVACMVVLNSWNQWVFPQSHHNLSPNQTGKFWHYLFSKGWFELRNSEMYDYWLIMIKR